MFLMKQSAQHHEDFFETCMMPLLSHLKSFKQFHTNLCVAGKYLEDIQRQIEFILSLPIDKVFLRIDKLEPDIAQPFKAWLSQFIDSAGASARVSVIFDTAQPDLVKDQQMARMMREKKKDGVEKKVIDYTSADQLPCKCNKQEARYCKNRNSYPTWLRITHPTEAILEWVGVHFDQISGIMPGALHPHTLKKRTHASVYQIRVTTIPDDEYLKNLSESPKLIRHLYVLRDVVLPLEVAKSLCKSCSPGTVFEGKIEGVKTALEFHNLVAHTAEFKHVIMLWNPKDPLD